MGTSVGKTVADNVGLLDNTTTGKAVGFTVRPAMGPILDAVGSTAVVRVGLTDGLLLNRTVVGSWVMPFVSEFDCREVAIRGYYCERASYSKEGSWELNLVTSKGLELFLEGKPVIMPLGPKIGALVRWSLGILVGTVVGCLEGKSVIPLVWTELEALLWSSLGRLVGTVV